MTSRANSSPLKKFFARRKTVEQAPEPREKDSSGVEALLRKVKRIDIISNRIANDMFSGQYRSAFRGQGIEFDEVREYTEGDDVRTIDWNVTARSNKPYVKRFSEERERSILFMLDVSASNLFGSKTSRLDTATEIAASLMFSALKSNDKVGLLTFVDGVRSFHPPRKGRNYVLRLLREMASAKPTKGKTDLNAALEYVNRTLKRRAVVFVISDFYVQELSETLDYCTRKHDVVAISITEPLEQAFSNLGFVTLRDPETGAVVELDSGSKRVRDAISARLAERRADVESRLKEARVDLITVENGGDYVQPLRAFFRNRLRR
ncbi:MAG: DUF58 domain-containing protein [Thermoguttaceae bacterium]|jgi:uncharacterized protein (DUF58 family)